MKLGDLETLLNMTILVVDDDPGILDLLKALLEFRGFRRILQAKNVDEAVRILESSQRIDLVLSDEIMPLTKGMQLLSFIKLTPSLASIPVIMISGATRSDVVVESIRLGAEDFLSKPIVKELLWARVFSSLERKHLRDREQKLLLKLQEEKQRSEELLASVMPARIANCMKRGDTHITELLPCVSVLFADMCGFTPLTVSLSPEELVDTLNELFLFLDSLADEYKIEKIKTIGDSYMACSGIDGNVKDHADRCAQFAKAAIVGAKWFNERRGIDINLRIGISSGSVISGIIGHKRPMFDMWGETVNIASRMESHGLPGRAQISEATYKALTRNWGYQFRGEIETKGHGTVRTYCSPDYVSEQNATTDIAETMTAIDPSVLLGRRAARQ